MRLDKLLSNKAFGSRKQVHELIKKGFVTVNNKVVSKKDMHIDLETDIVCVDGEPVDTKQEYYIKFHKPAGYVTALEDTRHATVMDLLPPEFRTMGVTPVGRLDKDTEGLLLLTNDGQWGHRIIHGKKDIWKTYEFTYEGTLASDAVDQIEAGITLGNEEVCKPGRLTIHDKQTGTLEISEGKYHQVKRMLQAIGGEVTYLKRVRIDNITLQDIEKPGEYTDLSIEEVENFK